MNCFQRDAAGFPGGAAEEFGRHAGADAGREGLPGDRVPAGEGQYRYETSLVFLYI